MLFDARFGHFHSAQNEKNVILLSPLARYWESNMGHRKLIFRFCKTFLPILPDQTHLGPKIWISWFLVKIEFWDLSIFLQKSSNSVLLGSGGTLIRNEKKWFFFQIGRNRDKSKCITGPNPLLNFKMKYRGKWVIFCLQLLKNVEIVVFGNIFVVFVISKNEFLIPIVLHWNVHRSQKKIQECYWGPQRIFWKHFAKKKASSMKWKTDKLLWKSVKNWPILTQKTSKIL